MKSRRILITPLGRFEGIVFEHSEPREIVDKPIKENMSSTSYVQIQDEEGNVYIFPKGILQNSVIVLKKVED